MTTGGSTAQKYLFFVTDKFTSEADLEETERLKLKQRLDEQRYEGFKR
jgi:hypothetical protein